MGQVATGLLRDEEHLVLAAPQAREVIPDFDVLALPHQVDYRNLTTAIKDQEDRPSCVAFAVCAAVEVYLLRWPVRDLSERWLYYECKQIDQFPNEEGTSFLAALKVAKEQGLPPEITWPYRSEMTQPGKWARLLAPHFRISQFYHIPGPDHLRAWLAAIGPCVLGVEVAKTMIRPDGAVIPPPPSREAGEGLHAVCAIGYNEQGVWIKNSWSKDWALEGYGILTWAYLREYWYAAWGMIA